MPKRPGIDRNDTCSIVFVVPSSWPESVDPHTWESTNAAPPRFTSVVLYSSSTSAASGMFIGTTPHSSAMCWSAAWWWESPITGRRGRSLATTDAVRPV